MEKLTYHQIRLKLADIIKPTISSIIVDIYESNISKYDENQLIVLMKKNKSKTQEFVNEFLVCKSLDDLCHNTEAEIICCFYYRYWVLINLLQMSQKISPKETINVPVSKKEFLFYLLFDVVDGN